MKHLIYLAGQPGSGKSTLMARLTEPFDRIPVLSEVNHDMLRDPETGHVVGAEIGEHRGDFSGTDLLPASIIDVAVPWIQRITDYDVILAEGQRLANKRFLSAAFDAGYVVIFALLDHSDAESWQRKRAKHLGRIQNDNWVQSRLTAVRTLADQLADLHSTGYMVMRGHPDALYPPLAALISTDG